MCQWPALFSQTQTFGAGSCSQLLLPCAFCFPLQDLEKNSRQQEELLREQAALKGEIQEYLRKRKECQERHKKRQSQLQQLQKKIEEKETELAQQEAVMSTLSCLTSS